MNAIEIMLIGSVMLVAIIYQIYLFFYKDSTVFTKGEWGNFSFDDIPRRVKPPLALGLAAFLGCIIFAIFTSFMGAADSAIVARKVIAYGIKAFILMIVACVKSYFGPIFSGLIISFTIYSLFEFGELKTIPVLRLFLGWVFSTNSLIIYWIYVGVCFTYALGSSF